MNSMWNFPEEVRQEFLAAVVRTGMTPQLQRASRILDNMFNDMTPERVEKEMLSIYLEMV